MAFKRRETVTEAIDLNSITPEDAEKRIIAGVKKYATNEANWSSADRNTPFLGHIVGMGIESSNLADITMSIERQFLTRKTTKVPLAEGSSEFKLEDGELGKLRILDGQDAFAATPGLSLKMLMDLGHRQADPDYLREVVPYADIATIGDGYRLNDALRKTLARTEKASGTEREDAQANLNTLSEQGASYLALIADPAQLTAGRRKVFEADQASHRSLEAEYSLANEKLKGVAAAHDQAQIAKLQAELAELKTRLRLSAQKLRGSSESVSCGEQRCAAAAAKFKEITRQLSETLAQAQKLAV